MALRSERSCLALPTTCNNMRTTAPSFRISQSDERTTNAPVQISAPGSTISIDTWHHHKSLSGGTASFEFIESSAAAISIILDLESGNGSLTILNSRFQLPQTRSECP